MGMVLRGLDNYKLMSIIYMKNYPKEFKAVEPSVKYKFYNRLYSYLKRINIDTIENAYTIGDSFGSADIAGALDELILFSQNLEEYEKCAKILKYKDLLLSEFIKNLIKQLPN